MPQEMPLKATQQLCECIQSTIQQDYQHYSAGDRLVVHSFQAQVAIEYYPAELQLGNSPDTMTELRIICYPSCHLAWLAYLVVAKTLRRSGHGQQLASLGESIARQLQCFEVRIRPLCPSEPFWRKMGYRPQPGTSQVFSKGCIAARQ